MTITQGVSSDRASWRTLVPAMVMVGVAAAIISIGRLWLFDRTAPTEVLWAEDGLFPLCIRKADFFTCLMDPFAGYLLFLPRVLAWPIAVLPWEYWALAANLVAASLAGVTAALALLIVRRAGLNWFTSSAVALLPVVAPMAGLEAINAIGSSYMLLLFLATLLIVLPPQGQFESSSIAYAVAGVALLVVTALTIPSAIVLLLLLVVAVIRRRWSWRVGVVWGSALIIGLIAQAATALTAEAPRQISFGSQTLQSWADSIPVSILTFWPGLSIGEYAFFNNFSLTPLAATGWLIAGVMVVVAVWFIVRGSGNRLAIGLLLVGGLGFGLIPSAIGFANNRYFVVPLLLWGTAVFVGLDPIIRRSRPFVVGIIVSLVLIIWWPAITASAFRATPAPPWSSEVDRIEAKCISDPAFVDRPLFTPFWPPNWGDGLIEPTHPNLPCTTVWRWLD